MIMKAILTISSILSAGNLLAEFQEKSYGTDKNIEAFSAIAKPHFDNSPFLEVDLIFWNVQQEGNDYASTGVASTVPDGINNPFLTNTPGEIFRPPSKVCPGFKIGAGLNLAHDLWDVAFTYTRIHSKVSDSISSIDGNAGIQPLFNYGDVTNSVLASGPIRQATCSFQLWLNTLDAELGKNFFLSPNFHLRVFFGLKSTFSKELFNAQYFVGFPLVNLDFGNNLVKFCQRFSGLGPRVGWHGDWQCVRPFGFFADAAISAVWNRFQTTARSFDTTLPATGVLIANQEYNIHTIVPVLEFSMGIKSEKVFKNGGKFLASAGWEVQTWLFQNQHSSSIADISLNMEGFTLKFRYDF